MPEGPEIKQIADALATALVGQKLTEVFFAFDHLKPWESVLCGRKVKRVRPRGKALLTELSDLAIYSHNQLYGRWFVVERGEELQTGRQLRLALHTRRHTCLLYSASDIEVLSAGDVESHSFISKLRTGRARRGDDRPDHRHALRRAAVPRSPARFAPAGSGFSRGPGQLPAQRNLILRARPSPAPAGRRLRCAARHALGQQTLFLTRQSYDTQGVTNDLDSYRALRRAGRTFGQSRHWVFDRQGDSCYECGETIEKISVNSRRLYYCPHCQTQ